MSGGTRRRDAHGRLRALAPLAVSASVRLVASASLVGVALPGCGLVGGDGGGYAVTAYFDRAVALYESSDVRVLGLPAGEVADIVVEANRVRVELEVDDNVPLPVDVQAALVPQSLIGERYVQLTPAWIEGQDRLQDLPEDERIIERDETIIPVEPDEALAAINEFLEQLDPDDFGRLVENAAEDLEGNGASLNRALGGISDLVDGFARRDQELASIIDNFDVFTRTLVTRESQLGEVIETFASTTSVLAQERQSLEALLSGLARVSQDGFDLVAEHATALRTDLDTLGQLGQSLVANLDAVARLLDSAPILADGLHGAYNPTLRAMNLRTQFGPLAQVALEPVLQAILGDDFVLPCIPIDTACPPGSLFGNLVPRSVAGADEGAAVATSVTPIDDVLALLGSPAAPASRASSAGDSPSVAGRVADGLGWFGGFLRDAAGALTGVGS